jgi:hypothetical protein
MTPSSASPIAASAPSKSRPLLRLQSDGRLSNLGGHNGEDELDKPFLLRLDLPYHRLGSCLDAVGLGRQHRPLS